MEVLNFHIITNANRIRDYEYDVETVLTILVRLVFKCSLKSKRKNKILQYWMPRQISIPEIEHLLAG